MMADAVIPSPREISLTSKTSRHQDIKTSRHHLSQYTSAHQCTCAMKFLQSTAVSLLIVTISLLWNQCHASSSFFSWLKGNKKHQSRPPSPSPPPTRAPISNKPRPPKPQTPFIPPAPPYVPPHMHQCMSLIQDPHKHHALWMHARRAAKRHYPLPKNTTFTPTMFLTTDHDVRVFNISHTPMQYRINWKGGSSNMVTNLETLQEQTGGYLPPYRAAHADTNTESRLISRGFGFPSLHSMKSFTFVRDPMSHFLAGLREYYFRLYRYKFTLTPSFLEQDLYDMLDTNMTFLPSTLHSVMHIFPQAGILTFNANPTFVFYPNNLPNFVGKLENFDEDWITINQMYKLNVTLQKDVSVHPTQDDPNQVKVAFNLLMESNVHLRNALCILLHVDYLCFDYEVPKYCQGIVKNTFSKI